jgi:hypothetical protein
MPRKKSEKGPPPIEDLPESLRKAFVRLMAKYNLDIVEAYEKLAVLADINSREFDAAVDKKANSVYKSRLMTQMNAARVSINRSANSRLNEKYSEGYNDGYAEGKNDNAIYYYCDVCQKPLYVQPNTEAHQAVVTAMHKLGWGHQSCHEKRNKRN